MCQVQGRNVILTPYQIITLLILVGLGLGLGEGLRLGLRIRRSGSDYNKGNNLAGGSKNFALWFRFNPVQSDSCIQTVPCLCSYCIWGFSMICRMALEMVHLVTRLSSTTDSKLKCMHFPFVSYGDKQISHQVDTLMTCSCWYTSISYRFYILCWKRLKGTSRESPSAMLYCLLHEKMNEFCRSHSHVWYVMRV